MDQETEAPPKPRKKVGEIGLTHIKLAENYAEAWATAQPVGTIELMGRTLKVRCATEEDAGAILTMTEKSIFAGFHPLNDTKGDQFLEIAAMALRGNDPPIDLAFLKGLPVASRAKLIEVVMCFLWVGPV